MAAAGKSGLASWVVPSRNSPSWGRIGPSSPVRWASSRCSTGGMSYAYWTGPCEAILARARAAGSVMVFTWVPGGSDTTGPDSTTRTRASGTSSPISRA